MKQPIQPFQGETPADREWKKAQAILALVEAGKGQKMSIEIGEAFINKIKQLLA